MDVYAGVRGGQGMEGRPVDEGEGRQGDGAEERRELGQKKARWPTALER